MVGYQEVQLRSEALEMSRRRNGQTIIRTAPYAVALALVLACSFLAGCDAKSDDGPANFPGDPKRGMDLIKQYGCGGCHLIPSIVDATGNVGPPLLHVGTRTYIAGFFSNSPEKHGAVDPGSAKGAARQCHAANGRHAAGFARHHCIPLHPEMKRQNF
jgi:hypothetical protein